MKQVINLFMLIGLAALLVWAAIQAASTMQAGWFILLGVQTVFFLLAFIQTLAKEQTK